MSSNGIWLGDEKMGICRMCRAYMDNVAAIHIYGKGIAVTFHLCREHRKQLSDCLLLDLEEHQEVENG